LTKLCYRVIISPKDYKMTLKYSIELGQAFGMLSLEEINALSDITKSLPKNPLVVNIGAGTGTSSLVVAETRDDAEIWTIDMREGGPYGGLENERNAFNIAGLPRPNQILSMSVEAAKIWKDANLEEEIDLLIIDAGHLYDECADDIKSWKPMVKKDGIILFHDYNAEPWPGVALAVDLLMNKCTELGIVGTYKWFKND
jgi:predicted O-methyltransferase YrrM